MDDDNWLLVRDYAQLKGMTRAGVYERIKRGAVEVRVVAHTIELMEVCDRMETDNE